MSEWALRAWAGLEVLGPIDGGHRNQVRRGRLGPRDVVLRRSAREPDSIVWELELLEHLGGNGLRVPATVPADDGRRHVGGLVVQEFLRGGGPRGREDWVRVRDHLEAVHALTAGWPQRPGSAPSRDLLTADRGGDVSLDRMAAEDAAAIREAWSMLPSAPMCVVHGDVQSANVILGPDGVALVDWDEARVDLPWFDHAALPPDVDVPFPGDLRTLARAGLAWEVATCWVAEPDYARRRLREFREGPG